MDYTMQLQWYIQIFKINVEYVTIEIFLFGYRQSRKTRACVQHDCINVDIFHTISRGVI